MDIPPLLDGGFPPEIKALTAALRRCSSSISRLRLRRVIKMRAPAMAATPRTPTTLPTAIPTVFDELSELLDESDVGVTVITTPVIMSVRK
jgi:hypothetical protein